MSSNLYQQKKTIAKESYQKVGLTDLAEEFGYVESPTEIWLNKFLTNDPDLNKVKEQIRVLAKKENYLTNVLIIGDTGTGKELLANALHGPRAGKFVAVNCGGIPDTLLESEFFGSVQGGFTGARDRIGYLEEAAKGTLFLDEIGEMPPLIQSKLLRVIQSRKARRIGSTSEYDVDCRFVSATNRETAWLLSKNANFRSDLFYRLAGFTLHTKPLWMRQDDIKLIIKDYFISHGGQVAEDRFLVEWNKLEFKDSKILPGNVRELLNTLNAWRMFNV